MRLNNEAHFLFKFKKTSNLQQDPQLIKLLDNMTT